MAVVLGPSGIGLEAIFDSVVSLARTLFDLGVGTSGVRQIASAVSSDSDATISRTVFTLRRVCLFLGILGAVTIFFARDAISRLAFGDSEQSANVGLLSIILLFGSIAGGQGALLNGMRRIGDLAWMNIWGTLIGAAISILIVLVWGQDGIAAYMVISAGVGVLVGWIYARRIRLPTVQLAPAELFHEAGALVRLGLAFMMTNLMALGAVFVLRVLVTRTEGIEAAGQFQAASALSMVYVGFILQAMGTDFFPRLTAVANDNVRCNQVVNEQAEISFLLALPGILATIAFCPWVILVFYSSKFDVAAEILVWQMAGMFLRLAAWPMGFILMAKGWGVTFVLTDAAAWTVYILLAWFGLKVFGLPGVGMAFLGLYVFYGVLIYVVVRAASGFRWSAVNLQLLILGGFTVALALWTRLNLPEPWGTAAGAVLGCSMGVYCLRKLIRIVGMERVKRFVRKYLPRSRFLER